MYLKKKKEIEQNLQEEDMRIWLTSVQENTPITWNITPDTIADSKLPNLVFSLMLSALYA